MFTASRFSSDRTESRTRSTNVFTAFSLTRLPGGTISRTTGVEASASRNGRRMQARMGTPRYLNVDNERGGGFLIYSDKDGYKMAFPHEAYGSAAGGSGLLEDSPVPWGTGLTSSAMGHMMPFGDAVTIHANRVPLLPEKN